MVVQVEGRVVEWRFLLLGPEPSNISAPCTAHSIISVMMSARAGGPRNTHQQKDYPCFEASPGHLCCRLACSFRDLSPLPSAPPYIVLRGLMGKMICEQKINCPAIVR